MSRGEERATHEVLALAARLMAARIDLALEAKDYARARELTERQQQLVAAAQRHAPRELTGAGAS